MQPVPAYIDFKTAVDSAAVQALALPFPEQRFSGRGLVIAAGGARMFTCAWVAIRMIRDFLASAIPIEVWHLGATEMSPAMAALLAEQDVAVVDALSLPEAAGARMLGGWELKAFAALNCRFREVILLDADNVPLIDPATLFDHADYCRTGTLFWPDIVALSERSAAWDMCGVAFRQMPSLETGQMVIDKQRSWAGLNLAWFLNNHSDTFYQAVYGDKDTFLLSWLRLGLDYTLIPHPVRRLHGCLCQHHPDGRILFQHRNYCKWILHGPNPPVDGFAEETRCLDYLEELRGRWNGRIFLPPRLGSAGHALAAEIISQQYFEYELVSDRMRVMQLLPCNLVGEGFALDEAHWWIEETLEDLALCIGEDEHYCVRLKRSAPGQWKGQWAVGQMLRVVVTATPPEAERPRAGHNTLVAARLMQDWARHYDALEGKM